MPRAIWSGSIGFGLVNVPVKLFSAVEEKGVHFHQFKEGTDHRIRNKRVDEETGKEVEYDQIVKGYEVSKGRYVMVTPEELEAVEPGKTRTIDIEQFVDLEELDPIYFSSTYYLAPDEGADKAYALLLDAMAKSGKVAIARFVMRTKQYLAAVRPGDGILLLETMHFPDEIRDTGDLDLPGKVSLSDKERKIAKQLIESLSEPFDPAAFHDTYRERVLELLKAKGKGKELKVERPQDDGRVLDLMAALEASVKAARSGKKPSEAAPPAEDDADELAEMSKADLLKLAAERNVDGRSKMKRDELEQALREAS
jgi:DNA end-binding protein Ku